MPGNYPEENIQRIYIYIYIKGCAVSVQERRWTWKKTVVPCLRVLSQLYNGHAVAQVVGALRYKPKGREFDSRCCHWNFSLTWSFWPQHGPGADTASNRSEYQEYFLRGKDGRCVGLTTLPPSCADCLEIWERQTPETLRACPGL
jgi:hypothetical protein